MTRNRASSSLGSSAIFTALLLSSPPSASSRNEARGVQLAGRRRGVLCSACSHADGVGRAHSRTVS